MASKWTKRKAKLQGLLCQIYSLVSLRYTRFNVRLLRRQITGKGINRLHVGCGNVLLKDWLNVFYEKRQVYGQVQRDNGALRLNYNLLKPWPVASNSIDFIAGSHFIEHLDLNDGLQFLQEAFRVLRSGGTIRLSCPDLEIYANHYVKRDKAFFDHKLIREWCTFKKAETPGEIFIAKAYDSGGSHKWFYDFDSLKHVLESAGFVRVKKCGRLEGVIPDLQALEPPGRELETLYVEAVKP